MGIQAGLIIHEQPRRSTGIPCSEANGTEPPPRGMGFQPVSEQGKKTD